jgi:hypothetical protein
MDEFSDLALMPVETEAAATDLSRALSTTLIIHGVGNSSNERTGQRELANQVMA